jgi:pyruvate,orthophosphate dikinase
MRKWVYTFGGGVAEGSRTEIDQLGGKGANLAEMAALGLPVPPGLTIVSDACGLYYKNGRSLSDELKAQVLSGISGIEAATGRAFGDISHPLLLSVRSGSRTSMPGMMDTDPQSRPERPHGGGGLRIIAGDARFAWDSYRRFIQMYGECRASRPGARESSRSCSKH